MRFHEYERLAFSPPAEMGRVQSGLLQRHVQYCAEHSPWSRQVLAEAGIAPAAVSLERLGALPLTGKEQLEKNNDAFLAASPESVVDIVFSSGTTGAPTRIVYTERDLDRLAYNESQSFSGAGITKSDIVLLTCTMDRCFVAGLAYFLGVRRLGAAAIRNGHGTMDGHLEIIHRVSPTVIIGVPSFLRKLGEHVRAAGMAADKLKVRSLICIGEPVRDADLKDLPICRDLKELWAAGVHSTYASSETVTTFCECTEQRGGHLHPELGIVEILDDQDRPVPPGAVGEVVVTPLGVEGMPFIRFRTGDLSFLLTAPCPCGRQSPRLGPILARKKQMIKFKGTTLYPQAIADALAAIPAVVEHFVEVRRLDQLSDDVAVHVAVTGGSWDAQQIADRLLAKLRVKPTVIVEPLETVRRQVFPPESRKPIRFIDRRTL
jgi:phenylacetate-CoA ligase